MRNAEKRIVVGRIAGVFGVKGWLKVMSYTSPRENILHYTPWQLQLKDTWREVSVQDWKAHNKGLTIALEGIDDRDVARALTGAVITLFPEMLAAVRDYGVTGRAVKSGIIRIEAWNPRDYADDNHRTVDDRPYGGGPGM